MDAFTTFYSYLIFINELKPIPLPSLSSSDEIWYYHLDTPTAHMIHPDGTYEAVEIDQEKVKNFQFTVPAGRL